MIKSYISLLLSSVNVAGLLAALGVGSGPTGGDSGFLRPTTYPTLVASATDGVYTVTPAVWPTGTVVTGKTKRRDQNVIIGFDSTASTITVDTVNDPTHFIDYQETGTLNGNTFTCRSNGIAVPNTESPIRDLTVPSTVTTSQPITTVFPTGVDVYGPAADLSKMGTVYVAGKSNEFHANNFTDFGYIIFTSTSPEYSIEFDLANSGWAPVWDYDPATGNCNTLTLGGTYANPCYITNSTLVNGQPSGGTVNNYAGGTGVVNMGRSVISNSSDKKIRIDVGPSGVFYTNADDNGVRIKTALNGRPMQTGLTKTGKFGLRYIKNRNAYDAITNVIARSNASPLTVSTFSTGSDQKFVVGGTYQGTAPTGLEMRVETLLGEQIEDWRALSTFSATGGVFSGSSATFYGRNSKLFNSKARVQVRNVGVTPVTQSSYIMDVPVYTPPANAATFGQNVAGFTAPGSNIRTHTNMLKQSYIQALGTVPGMYDNDGVTLSTNPTFYRNSPGYTDAKGWLIKNAGGSVSRITHWHILPEQQNQTVTLQLKWTGGPISIIHGVGSSGTGTGIVSRGAITNIDANTKEWTLVIDRTLATGRPWACFDYVSIDEANPPKDMTLCIKGEDLNQWYKPSYIDFLKQLPGRLRWMDDWGVNGSRYYENKPVVWANRNKRDNGIANGTAIEDMIDLSNLSGRPFLWNIPPWWGYEEGGLDAFDKAVDLIFKGIGADTITPTVAGGITQQVVTEVGNENWNIGGFGGMGAGPYMYRQAVKRGAVPPFDYNSGSIAIAATRGECNYLQELFHTRLQARVPDWKTANRLVRTVNCLMSVGVAGLDGAPGWSTAKLYIDEITRAPYLPNDPNAGGQAANFTDRTPQGIVDFLRTTLASTSALLASCANYSRSLGFTHGIYEVALAVVSLNIDIAQKKALYSSPILYNFFIQEFLPALADLGGDIALYSDQADIFGPTAQEWGFFRGPNSPYNMQWDAVVNFGKGILTPLPTGGSGTAPTFTTQPTFSPSSGTAGTTSFTANDGVATGATSYSRVWKLDGTSIGTGVSVTPSAAGTLTLQVTATNPSGSTLSNIVSATVSAVVVTPAPVFTTQPVVTNTNSGNVGDTWTISTAAVASNAVSYANVWKLDGTTIGTGNSVTPNAAGTLTLVVTATNGTGSTASNTITKTVLISKPVFTVQPTVTPTTGVVGTTFSANQGTVTGANTIAYAWSFTGASGTVNDTTATFTPTEAGTLTYRTVAINSGGTTISNPVTAAVTVASFVGTAWNSLDKMSEITLTNSNSTATRAGAASASRGSVRGTDGQDINGCRYFEVTAKVASGSETLIGLGTKGMALNGLPAQLNDFTSVVYASTGNTGNSLGSFVNVSAPFADGEVVGVAVNYDNNRVYFRNAAGWIGGITPTTGTALGTGTALTRKAYPNVQWFPFVTTNNNGDGGTLNIGNQPFAYTPPTGFTAWTTGAFADGARPPLAVGAAMVDPGVDDFDINVEMPNLNITGDYKIRTGTDEANHMTFNGANSSHFSLYPVSGGLQGGTNQAYQTYNLADGSTPTLASGDVITIKRRVVNSVASHKVYLNGAPVYTSSAATTQYDISAFQGVTGRKVGAGSGSASQVVRLTVTAPDGSRILPVVGGIVPSNASGGSITTSVGTQTAAVGTVVTFTPGTVTNAALNAYGVVGPGNQQFSFGSTTWTPTAAGSYYFFQTATNTGGSLLVSRVPFTVTATQAYVTLDSNNKSSSITLDSAKLTATRTTGAGTYSAARVTNKNVGKKYFEMKANVNNGIAPFVGNLTTNVSNVVQGLDTNAVGWYAGYTAYNDTALGYSGVALGSSAATTFVAGDTLMLAFDTVAKKVWAGKNGVWINGDPAAGTGGLTVAFTDFYAGACFSNGTATDVSATFNFGASAFTYAAPTGFTGIYA